MATSGSDPQLPKPSGLQGAVSSSRTGAQSKLLHSENERQSPWSPFPMGQRPKNTFRKTSSYLLQQLIHCSQESDADRDYEDQEEGEGEGEGKVEFEESSESEMLNFEVCLPPTPYPLASFSSGRTPHQPAAEPITRAPCLQERLFLTALRVPLSPSHFCYSVSSPFA